MKRGDKGTFKGQEVVIMSVSQPGVYTVRRLSDGKVIDILRRDLKNEK